MSNEVTTHQPQHTFADLQRMAKAVAGSGLFGVKTEDQALALMLLAQAEGLHPAIAARDYHLVDGKPTLKADTMLARFMGAGGKVEWHDVTDQKVSATFSHPRGSSPLKVEWTWEQAVKAKLTTRDNWVKYPRAMLRSRVVSEGIRSVYPQVITGIYEVNEMRDGVAEEIDVTPPRSPSPAPAEEPPIEVDTETGEIREPQPEPQPTMSEGQITDYIAAIEAAATLEDLRRAHARAYNAAHKIGDKLALMSFEVAKDAAKYKLAKEGAT